MNKKGIILMAFIIVVTLGCVYFFKDKGKVELQKHELVASVLAIDDDKVTVQDESQIIYTFYLANHELSLGDKLLLTYTGVLKYDALMQDDINVISYQVQNENDDELPMGFDDKGIFSSYYKMAYDKLKTLSLDEKIAQLLLVRYPNDAKEVMQKYQFAGYVFYGKDFASKDKDAVNKMIDEVNSAAKIPLLTAVDEEGGKIVRASDKPMLASEPFASSKELYEEGGLPLIAEDTIKKSQFLKSLGLNLNLAPVVDVSLDPSSYIYERTLGHDTDETAEYAKTVISASKGTGVSYTLKHFPGYGNNGDTHDTESRDEKSLEEIKKTDLPPFEAGIEAGAEAVLVSHNIVLAVDSENPASLSPAIHNLLRKDLNFTGIIMTDDLDMGAVSALPDATKQAILAGNDLIITTDYEESFKAIKNAIQNKEISESQIEKLAFRVIAWKYYKGLLLSEYK